MYVSVNRFLAVLAVLVCGCNGKGVDAVTGDTGPDLPAEIELGTGDVEFQRLQDGDDCLIIFGPQGGYHFWASMHVQGINPGDPDALDNPDNPVTSFQAFRDGVQIDLGSSTYKQGLDPQVGSAGEFQMIGRQLRLDITNDDELSGVEVLLTLDLTDADGVELHDERTVVGVPSPFNNDG